MIPKNFSISEAETRGNIVLLEDSLSQIPSDYIKDITGGKYNTKIVVNEFKPDDNFPTKVFSGQTSQFLVRILNAVANDERFIVVATSQEFLEKLGEAGAVGAEEAGPQGSEAGFSGED